MEKKISRRDAIKYILAGGVTAAAFIAGCDYGPSDDTTPVVPTTEPTKPTNVPTIEPAPSPTPFGDFETATPTPETIYPKELATGDISANWGLTAEDPDLVGFEDSSFFTDVYKARENWTPGLKGFYWQQADGTFRWELAKLDSDGALAGWLMMPGDTESGYRFGTLPSWDSSLVGSDIEPLFGLPDPSADGNYFGLAIAKGGVPVMVEYNAEGKPVSWLNAVTQNMEYFTDVEPVAVVPEVEVMKEVAYGDFSVGIHPDFDFDGRLSITESGARKIMTTLFTSIAKGQYKGLFDSDGKNVEEYLMKNDMKLPADFLIPVGTGGSAGAHPERHGNLKWVPAGVEIDLSKPIVIVPIMTEKDLDKLDPEMLEKLMWPSGSTIVPPVIDNTRSYGIDVSEDGQISLYVVTTNMFGNYYQYLNDGPANVNQSKLREAREYLEKSIPSILGQTFGQLISFFGYSDSRDMTLFEVFGYIGGSTVSWKREFEVNFLKTDVLLSAN